MTLSFFGRGLEDRPTSQIVALAVVGALFPGVAWLNAYSARKLQNELDAVDA